jgi:pSer/pThr/pTyr-binding forkhead associated (FHA) protein
MKLRLQITPSSGASFIVEQAGPRIRIGRDPAGELALGGEGSATVSWEHARIDLTPRGAYLSDLRSVNGTFVNGRRVTGPAALAPGHEVRLGQSGPVLRVVEIDLSGLVEEPTPAAVSARAYEAPEPYSAPEEVSSIPSGLFGDLPQWPQRLLMGLGVVALGVLIALALRFSLGGSRGKEITSEPDKAPQASATQTSSSAVTPSSTREKPAATETARAARAPATPPAGPTRPEPSPENTRSKPAAPAAPPVERPSEVVKTLGKFVPVGASSIVLVRGSGAEPWKVLLPDGPVASKSSLVGLPGYRSEVRLDSGVRLQLWGNVPDFSAYPPVLESAVTLHVPAPGIDADFTLERGRVHLASTKPEPAHVRVRFQRETWDVTLPDAQSEVVLELWGYHNAPTPATTELAGKRPVLYLGLFTKGQAEVQVGGQKLELPNQGQLTWSNAGGTTAKPAALPRLPDWWTEPPTPPTGRKVDPLTASLKQYAGIFQRRKAVDEALLVQFRQAPDPMLRALAMLYLGAMDSLPELVEGLEDEQYPNARKAAVYALTRWASRGTVYDQEVARTLRRTYKDDAAILMGLMRFFPQTGQTDPAVCRTLVEDLGHERLAVRELAAEHLTVLMPEAAQKIGYDPAAAPEARRQAAARWSQQLAGK